MKGSATYSMTISFSMLLLVLIVSPVSAGDENPFTDEYTILCSSEERTGFDWRNGEWKPVQFKNTKRLIVKSNKNQCGARPAGGFEGDNMYLKWVCLNERQLGDKYNPSSSHYCEEQYYPPFGTLTSTTLIYCDHPKMWVDPNGWYHYAYIAFDIKDNPKDDYKDSQYVEVGKCGMIKP